MLVLGSYKGKYAMTRRPETAKFLKATLGFPTLIADRKHQWSGEGFEAPGWVKQAITAPVTSIVKHNITSHRIHARVVLVTLDRAPANAELLAAKDVESRLVSNLDRKAWIALDILKKI